MKLLRVPVVLFFMIFGLSAYGQDNPCSKSMIEKITSISKAENVELGQVKILFITNRFDNTNTNEKSITKKGKFHFDESLLVIDDTYFNMDKLLYFHVKKGVMVFFFQAY